MEGAARRNEYRRAEIWYTAMLPHLKKPPSLREFSGGKTDRPAALRECLAAWDKMDRALMSSKRASL